MNPAQRRMVFFASRVLIAQVGWWSGAAAGPFVEFPRGEDILRPSPWRLRTVADRHATSSERILNPETSNCCCILHTWIKKLHLTNKLQPPEFFWRRVGRKTSSTADIGSQNAALEVVGTKEQLQRRHWSAFSMFDINFKTIAHPTSQNPLYTAFQPKQLYEPACCFKASMGSCFWTTKINNKNKNCPNEHSGQWWGGRTFEGRQTHRLLHWTRPEERCQQTTLRLGCYHTIHLALSFTMGGSLRILFKSWFTMVKSLRINFNSAFAVVGPFLNGGSSGPFGSSFNNGWFPSDSDQVPSNPPWKGGVPYPVSLLQSC